MASHELILTDDVARMMGIKNSRVTAKENDVHTAEDFYQRDMYLLSVEKNAEEKFDNVDIEDVK